jgi:pimeloyl-ACP methyl ester carboxylesterase
MELDPTGEPIDIDGVVLVTPGLEGRAEVHYGVGGAVRGVDLRTPAFAEALEETGVREQLTVAIERPAEMPIPRAARTRSLRSGGDGIEVTVPGPGSGLEQVLLYVGENGAISWHFGESSGTAGVRSGAGRRTYVVPRAVAPASAAAPTRGLFGAAGRKVLKVLTFKLMDKAAGVVGDFFVRRWESEYRPHRLRELTAGNIADGTAPDLSRDRLRDLGGSRALLFIHGTASRTHSAFATVPPALLEALSARYSHRVLAFDHPTVGSTPTENAAWLGQELEAAGAALDVDIVAHSRGGLVARELAERPGEGQIPAGALNVGTVVFVATPNAGTALAGFDRLGDFVDRLTNLLDFAPDNPVTDPLSMIITVVKQLAVGALKGLDGLTAMTPGGDYLATLNAPCEATAVYRAVTANFEPAPGSSLATIARDATTDLVFGHDNDLVVPTAGVYEPNGGSLFPIADPVIFDAAAAVSHSAYWPRPEVVDAFGTWLTAR